MRSCSRTTEDHTPLWAHATGPYSTTFGKRSFTGSFNARACDWQGIRKSSVFWKQERQEGCFQARFLMSSSSVRIPWDMLRSQHSYYKVLGRFSSVLMRVVDSGSHSPFRVANLSWKWRITRLFLPMCPIPFRRNQLQLSIFKVCQLVLTG